ncbi:RNA polymerase sigma-70 factor (ECF subfamily) [Rhodococcus sp. SMB37]|uniref:RNA polymerase subunit sigma-24 n=1 Tax=Rhodococcus sp. SMB37 TaxID=2512213 RepID=UPI001051C8EB|nr:RNA polymerase subunit sigma-24 [Rhodococcus sp. SMB37]TCN45891.1 RNA polymerase sigma-70 factor (ECF subfamily) [Rhodococcus sp. SMB37]
MTTVRGNGVLGHFTMCELAWSVAAGDAAAMPALLRQLYPQASAYCRARARDTGVSFTEADRLALEVCHAILAEVSSVAGAQQPFARLAYATAVDAADSRFAHPVGGAGTRTQREILILRTIVGLDLELTAIAMGISPRRVRAEQHAALRSLRAA